MKRLVPFLLAFAFATSAPAAEQPGIWDRVKEFFSRFTEGSEKPGAKGTADSATGFASHEAAVRDSLKAVTEKYPAVMKKDSAFNTEFCARVRKLQVENPDVFKTNGNWPMEIARNTAHEIALAKYEAQAARPKVDTVGNSDDEAYLSAQQGSQHLPVAARGASCGAAIPDSYQSAGAYDRSYIYSYAPSYFSNDLYYTTPANQYRAGPELTIRARDFADKVVKQYGGAYRVGPRTTTSRSPMRSPQQQNSGRLKK